MNFFLFLFSFFRVHALRLVNSSQAPNFYNKKRGMKRKSKSREPNNSGAVKKTGRNPANNELTLSSSPSLSPSSTEGEPVEVPGEGMKAKPHVSNIGRRFHSCGVYSVVVDKYQFIICKRMKKAKIRDKTHHP